MSGRGGPGSGHQGFEKLLDRLGQGEGGVPFLHLDRPVTGALAPAPAASAGSGRRSSLAGASRLVLPRDGGAGIAVNITASREPQQ